MADSAPYGGLFSQLNRAGLIVVANMQDPFWPGFPLHAPWYAEGIVANLSTAALRQSADRSVVIVMGHSMGGIIAQDSAASSFALARPELRGLIVIHAPSLAPWDLPHATAPALYLAGSDDWIAWPSTVRASFNTYGGGPRKVFAEVSGAGHTQVLAGDDLGEANATASAAVCFARPSGVRCSALCGLRGQLALADFSETGCSRHGGVVAS